MAESESWYDITLEEELEKERKSSVSSLSLINVSSSNFILHESRRGFPVLSPLKEIDRTLELKEEMLANEHFEEEMLSKEEMLTPKKTRLGPRASQRHSSHEEDENMAAAVNPSPRRKVKIEMVEGSPLSRDTNCRLGPRSDMVEGSPVSRNVKSRLGPRAASRHGAVTPEHIGNKRHFARDSPRASSWDSPQRDTDHKDKRHRVGTPTRDRGTPNQDRHIFSTPEPIRNIKKRDNGKFKTPNSDSRLYTKKSQTNRDRLSGAGKDLFGNTRKRGKSESVKENDEPLKALTEEQIAKREKQVLYGKVTDGYQNYKSIIPKGLRNIRDPATPRKDYPYSKRCWDGLVRSWRRKLHEWDEPSVALGLRAAYTKNNKDLKDSGLVNNAGELVMFTSSEPAEETNETPEEEEPVSQPAEPATWDIPQFRYPAEDDTQSQDSEYTRLLGNKDDEDDTQSQDSEYTRLLGNKDEDDTQSQDSEYTRLLGNKDDFPDDSDDSDGSYHLSQDSHLNEELSQEGEMMDCEDETGMRVGDQESCNRTTVC
ncbi:uncharacterized protein LOC134817604 [Bolinopsis microptera]|uniref:uncharacterized protein LOC134817604 n=1 Tax=Bolinopsis microptera TaxID=2820187 RepID=UPI00307A8B18